MNFKLFVLFFLSGYLFLCPVQAFLLTTECDLSNKSLSTALQLYKRQQYLLSLQEFSLAQKLNCPRNIDRARWGYLQAVTQLNEVEEMYHLSQYELPAQLSSDYQSKLKLYQNYHFGLHPNSVEAQKVKLFRDWEAKLPQQKSPVIAGTLSAFIPGAGQAYVGSYQSAAMALILNALFLSSSIELQNKGLYTSSLVSGMVFSITYLGNILNASQSAHIYNQNYHRSAIEQERQNKLYELNP